MIGKKLKEFRQQFKLTGTTLAKLAGINQPYLSEIETEKKIPPMETFMNLVNAMSRNAPIDRDNYHYILTDDSFDDFVKMLEISVDFVDNAHFHKKYITHISYDNNEIYHSITDNRPNEKEIIETNISQQFFDSWKDDNLFNLTPIPRHNDEFSIVYSIDEIRESLYAYWYEYILGSFIYYLDDDEALNISDNELNLILQIQSLRNGDGSFTPFDENNTTNLSKELLNGKTVTFDIRSITDKNVRALLDGQLLSNEELTAIKFTLNGIRYNRNSKIFGISTQWGNEALKESKKEIEQVVIKEIGKIKFDGKHFGANRLEEETIQIKDLPLELQSDMARKLIKELVIKDGKIDIHYNF